MDFRSIYQHGFARVAACTSRVAIADPAANAEAVAAPGPRVLARRASPSRVFPELMPDRLLDRGPAAAGRRCSTTSRRALRDVVAAPPTCSRCSSSARRCATATGSTTARSSSTAGGCSASCRSPTCRPTASSTSAASSRAGDDERGTIRLAGEDVPFGPDLLFAADDVAGPGRARRGLRGHVGPDPAELPRRRWPARRCCSTSRAARSRSGRAEDRKLLCRSAVLALPGRLRLRRRRARASRPPTSSWDGQTMIHENGVLLAETERFPAGDRRAVADVDLDLLRQERLRMGTFDDNRRAHAERTGRLPPRRVHARPARPATSGCGARSSASRSSPPTPPGSSRTATRPTTSRSPACSSGCGRSATRRS